MYFKIFLIGLVLILFSCQSSENSESNAIQGAIVLMLGNDTTMIQQFTLENSQLNQVFLRRSPEVQLIESEATLDESGNIIAMTADYYKPSPSGESLLIYSNKILFEGDSTYITTGLPDEPRTRSFPGKLMVTNYMAPVGMFWFAPMANYAPSTVGDSLISKHLVYSPLLDFSVTRINTNEVIVGSKAMGYTRILLDENGRAVEIDGTGSSFNLKGKVVESIDLRPITNQFLKYEEINGKMGALTGKGRLISSYNGVNIEIAYGRPLQRGRKLFGGIVPWDKVWRTGSNAATKFTIDNDLSLSGQELPAGSYSLWTLPKENGNWELIINSEAEIWGTNYNAEFDVVRLPLTLSDLTESIEQFTFSVEEDQLMFQWGNTQATVNLD